jgi:tetratricopeptide (TPR) repeat protein
MNLHIWPRLLILAAVATLAASPVYAASGSDCLGNPDLVKKAEACQSIVDLRKEPPAVIAAALRELGLLHMARGDAEKTFIFLDEAVRLQPQDDAFLLARAGAQAVFRNFAAAAADYKAALVLKPNNPHTLTSLGWLLGMMGQNRKGIESLTKAIALSPLSGDAYAMRGSLRLNLQDYRRAARDFTQAIKLGEGTGWEVYAGRASAYYFLGNFRRSIRDFTTAESLGSAGPELYLMRGTMLQLQEKQHRALADFERLVEISPDNAPAYNGRCWSLAKTGKLEEALQDCNKALQLDATVTNIWDSRALVYELMGKLDLSEADYEKSLSLEGKNKWAVDGLKRVKALKKKSAP